MQYILIPFSIYIIGLILIFFNDIRSGFKRIRSQTIADIFALSFWVVLLTMLFFNLQN